MDYWAANPCSRRTSPPMGEQKVYCASTAQVWALDDALPEHLPAADVDFIRGVVHPVQQWPTSHSRLTAALRRFRLRLRRTLLYCCLRRRSGGSGEFLVTIDRGRGVGPWLIERVPYARPRSTSPRMTRS